VDIFNLSVFHHAKQKDTFSVCLWGRVGVFSG